MSIDGAEEGGVGRGGDGIKRAGVGKLNNEGEAAKKRTDLKEKRRTRL
jgi:hypothetical protein